jgi:hypothetical protein
MRGIWSITRLIENNPLLWSEGVGGRAIVETRSESSGIRWGMKKSTRNLVSIQPRTRVVVLVVEEFGPPFIAGFSNDPTNVVFAICFTPPYEDPSTTRDYRPSARDSHVTMYGNSIPEPEIAGIIRDVEPARIGHMGVVLGFRITITVHYILHVSDRFRRWRVLSSERDHGIRRSSTFGYMD